MASDYCGGKHALGTFRVTQENVACGGISCTFAVEINIEGKLVSTVHYLQWGDVKESTPQFGESRP